MVTRLVIFDFDGTLADSFPWFCDSLDDVATRFGIRRTDAAEREALRHAGPREILRRLDVPLWKLPRIVRYMRARKLVAAPAIPLFDGTSALLDRLVAHGLRLAIVSSDSEASIRCTLGAPLARTIDFYECGASLFGKPAHLRRVLRRAQIPATQALYVGDETRDAEAAARVGLRFTGVSWGYAAPDAIARVNGVRIVATMDDLAATLLNGR
jgi:phosphoglycolate phosphatase